MFCKSLFFGFIIENAVYSLNRTKKLLLTTSPCRNTDRWEGIAKLVAIPNIAVITVEPAGKASFV